MYIYIYICLYICIYIICMYISLSIYIYMYMYVYIYIYIYNFRQVYLYRDEPPPRKRTTMYLFLLFACNCILPFWNEVGSQRMVKTSNLKDNKASVHKHVTHIHIAQHVHIHEQLFNPRRCSESVCEDPPRLHHWPGCICATSGSQGFFGRVFLGRVSTREKDCG